MLHSFDDFCLLGKVIFIFQFDFTLVKVFLGPARDFVFGLSRQALAVLPKARSVVSTTKT